MSSIRVTITKELEPVIAFLEKHYEGLDRAEIVKLALSTLKRDREYSRIKIPKNLPVEYGTPKLEKDVKEAREDYENGQYETLTTPQDIREFHEKMLEEVDNEED